MSIADQLRARYSDKYDSHRSCKLAKSHFHGVLGAMDEISEKRAALTANEHLSDIGRTDEMRKFAPTLAKRFANARAAVKGAKDSILQQREALVPKVQNRTDVAAAILRSDFRNFCRGRSVADIMRVARSDRTAIEAISEAAPELSGLTAESRAQIVDQFLRTNCAPQLAEIVEQEEFVGLLKTAFDAASRTLADAVGIRADEFDTWLQQHAPGGADKTAAIFAAPPATETSDQSLNRWIEETRAEMRAAGVM